MYKCRITVFESVDVRTYQTYWIINYATHTHMVPEIFNIDTTINIAQ